MTKFDCCLLIALFCDRNSLSNSAKTQLIQLIRHILPINNNLPKTHESLYKFLKLNQDEIIEESYCSNCDKKLDRQKKCTNSRCSNLEIRQISPNYFTYVNIEKQITMLLEENHNSLNSFTAKISKLTDIVNGSYYNSIAVDKTIHVMLFTDGIELAKSSYYHFWPVFLTFIELPFSIRQSKNGIYSNICYILI